MILLLRLRNVKKILRSSRKYSGKLNDHSQDTFGGTCGSAETHKRRKWDGGLCFLGCWGTSCRERSLAWRAFHWGREGTPGVPVRRAEQLWGLDIWPFPVPASCPVPPGHLGSCDILMLAPSPHTVRKTTHCPPRGICSTTSHSNQPSFHWEWFAFHFSFCTSDTWQDHMGSTQGKRNWWGGVVGCWPWISRKLPHAKSVPGACPPHPI